MTRLILVRHGESSHGVRRGLLDAAGVQQWRDAYDLAGITDRSMPPQTLVRRVADATHIVASDLPRAIASAERLAGGRRIHTSPLLREIPLPIPRLPMRAPLAAWGTAMHLAWSYRVVRRDKSADELARVGAAIEWLTSVAGSELTVVVTHGVFRSSLARELLRLGWVSEGRKGGFSHWSEWTFARFDS
jgi:broad specificity phosphatase PhoE